MVPLVISNILRYSFFLHSYFFDSLPQFYYYSVLPFVFILFCSYQPHFICPFIPSFLNLRCSAIFLRFSSFFFFVYSSSCCSISALSSGLPHQFLLILSNSSSVQTMIQSRPAHSIAFCIQFFPMRSRSRSTSHLALLLISSWICFYPRPVLVNMYPRTC